MTTTSQNCFASPPGSKSVRHVEHGCGRVWIITLLQIGLRFSEPYLSIEFLGRDPLPLSRAVRGEEHLEKPATTNDRQSQHHEQPSLTPISRQAFSDVGGFSLNMFLPSRRGVTGWLARRHCGRNHKPLLRAVIGVGNVL